MIHAAHSQEIGPAVGGQHPDHNPAAAVGGQHPARVDYDPRGA